MLLLSRRSASLAASTTSLAAAVLLAHAVDAGDALLALLLWAGLALCLFSAMTLLGEVFILPSLSITLSLWIPCLTASS